MSSDSHRCHLHPLSVTSGGASSLPLPSSPQRSTRWPAAHTARVGLELQYFSDSAVHKETGSPSQHLSVERPPAPSSAAIQTPTMKLNGSSYCVGLDFQVCLCCVLYSSAQFQQFISCTLCLPCIL